MVLEPLSAFAVACNILQVLEVGCKLLVGATQRIKDGGELSNEHQELRAISRTINNLNAGLEKSLSPDPSASTLVANEQRLNTANEECLRISKEFIDLLDRLQVRQRHAVFETLKMSIKAYWFRDKIEALQKALSQARANLNFAFLLYMNGQQMTHAKETQDTIWSSTDVLEGRLTSLIESSSDRMQGQIQQIAEELKEVYLDSEDRALSAFLVSNQQEMERLSKKLESICLSQQQQHDTASVLQESVAQRKVLESLHFSDMFSRVEQISHAQSGTFQWMLRPLEDQKQRWSCFYSWLNAPEGSHRIYWIQGKPGSGKSTLLKFLYENLDPRIHMGAWSCGLPVYKARFFFWQTGTTLQKSLCGFYQAILSELLTQRPDSIPKNIGVERWKIASLPGASPLTWNISVLRSTLQQTIVSLCACAKIILLVDGIDEFDGTTNEQDQLLEFLTHLNQMENLKVCVSSRPWNIFQDVFGQVPQLRLEDLTRNDMLTTVTSLLANSSRWEIFRASYPDETASVVTEIVSKAHGVFLWVRLVMRDLLRGIQDGDSLPQLQQKLFRLPGDMNEYFKRMIDSIEPHYRREASMMLQIACFQETLYISRRQLRLLHLSFVDEQVLDFAMNPNFDLSIFDLHKPDCLQRLRFRIDSTLRKLHSRCMGLLECNNDFSDAYGPIETLVDRRGTITTVDQVTVTNLEEVFDLRIDFLHRSVREFLGSPQMQNFLHSYTDGPFDVRRFLCNARLVQIMNRSSHTPIRQVGVAGSIIPALSVAHTTQWSSLMFSRLQTSLVSLAEARCAEHEVYYRWYVLPSLESWSEEHSSPLTMAIDFDLSSYIFSNLTTEVIKNKRGRPILDYILRPRFFGTFGMRCGNHAPNIKILQLALARGADPNEKHEAHHSTVWETFLCLWSECHRYDELFDSLEHRAKCRAVFTEALMILLRTGAKPVVDWWALADDYPFERYEGLVYDDQGDPASRFNMFWPNAMPLEISGGKSLLYPVSSLLNTFQLFNDPSCSAFMEELRVLELNYIHKHGLLEQQLTVAEDDAMTK